MRRLFNTLFNALFNTLLYTLFNTLFDKLLNALFNTLFNALFNTLNLTLYFSVDDIDLDNNMVDSVRLDSQTEHGMSMNFYTENNHDKVPQSKLGSGDAILNAALQQHEASKISNGVSNSAVPNGSVENHKHENYTGLPKTEI